ncbi:MAG: NrfD/PsrC family molybdoenzyme membrane anchor subunit [Myxococcota bacterium]|nr:NrfD/PsrC family molybdoenzyme membrane anchor subunit [Myxococcota bacterium]MEC9389186.1 NrfD/PsrC family molybdoenzyme membrane anchor subunit [Myxococcota bacterium]
MEYPSNNAEAMVDTELSYRQVTTDVLEPLFKFSKAYWAGLTLVLLGLAYGGFCIIQQLVWGLGVAGYSQPVFWGLYITTFVFWVGIGHAGTLISAVLFLFRSKWRTGVYRAAEAMTIFAVMTAALFPALHVGRMWNAYWLFPYPNQRQLWQNFKSPLMWDVFAVSTYFTVSTIFFYIGLIPDFAAIRDRTRGAISKVYAGLAIGWRGTDRQWRHYMAAYGFFAAFATPLVLSVHSVVSWDFAMAQTAGWHSTLFPPYFVAGAIFSGCAMVITLLMPLSVIFKWDKYINEWHFEHLAKMCLLTGAILTYAYVMEHFIAWYSDNPYEWGIFKYRAVGDYWWVFWIMVVCNCVIPLVWWWKKARTNYWCLWIVSIFINIGMWFERFNIIASSLAHQFDPAAWTYYLPNYIEIGVLIFSFAWFFLWFLLFVKVMPSVAIAEVKELLPPPLRTDAKEAAK